MSKKGRRDKDLTSRYLAGSMDEDSLHRSQRFTTRSKLHQQRKTEKTTLMRLAEQEQSGDVEALPIGEVVQVYSLYAEVRVGSRGRLSDYAAGEDKIYLCVRRKTMSIVSETDVVVGDRVRIRPAGTFEPQGREEAVIEQVLPRKTVLTRAESFKQLSQHPIVANADQMLIVASIREPEVKWGLIDRMIIAAQAGKLEPVVCLNKIDLAASHNSGVAPVTENAEFEAILDHYESLKIKTLQTSVNLPETLPPLIELLKAKRTVLAGHSGVGKSSLIHAIQPHLDIRIGEISGYTAKGRHTTTSARIYDLDFGGEIIDTPGVKTFGLWDVTGDNLIDYFPDVAEENAPEWRVESYKRILSSLAEE